jgi:Nif-specific regulatory protein
LSPRALDLLLLQRWPGNVRQLRNVLERAVISATGPAVEPGDLDCEEADLSEPSAPGPGLAEGSLDEASRVRAALERSGYVQAKAARLLGMTVRQLAYRVRKYGIELERF